MIRFVKDIFFCNGFNLIFKAYKQKFIDMKDVLPDKDKERDNNTEYFLNQMETIKQSKWSFIKLVLKSFWKKWILVLVYSIILTVFVGVEPYLSTSILEMIKDHNKDALLLFKLIGLLFVSKGVKSLISNHSYYKLYDIGISLYVNMSLAIYKQSVKLQSNSLFNSSIKGKSLTLLEQDCSKLIVFPYFLNQLALVVVQTIYGLWYLNYKLPYCDFLIGYFVLIVYVIVALLLGYLVISESQIMLSRKDTRLSCSMNGIQNCNMQQQSIIKARNSELKSLRNIFRIQVLVRTCSIFFYALFLTSSLIWNYSHLDPISLYMIILIYAQINASVNQIPFLIQNFNQILVNLDRLLKFLNDNTQNLTSPTPFKNQHKKSLKQVKQFKKVGTVSWQAISFYMKSGGRLIFTLFVCSKLLLQTTNIASSFINKHLAKNTFHYLYQYFNPFLPVLPYAAAMALIFIFSMNTSKKIYSQIQVKDNNQSKSVLLNLLSNDLRIIDKIICINIFDCFSNGLSIIKTIALSLYSIGTTNKNYSLSMIPIVIIPLSFLVIINRVFMWTRRQYSRLQGISKTPFLQTFYESLDNIEQISSNSEQQKRVFRKLKHDLNQISYISLIGIYFQSFYELILILFSLILIISITIVASMIVEDQSTIGLIFSQILSLDGTFRLFFVSCLVFERNSIFLQRFYNIILKKSPTENNSIIIEAQANLQEQGYKILKGDSSVILINKDNQNQEQPAIQNKEQQIIIFQCHNRYS